MCLDSEIEERGAHVEETRCVGIPVVIDVIKDGCEEADPDFVSVIATSLDAIEDESVRRAGCTRKSGRSDRSGYLDSISRLIS